MARTASLSTPDNASGSNVIALWGAAVGIALVLVLFPQIADAQRVPQTFADVVEDVIPAVVNVSTTQLVEQRSRNRGGRNLPQMPRGGPLEDMFKDFLEQFGDQVPQGPGGEGDNDRPKRRASSLGSGFIIEADGLVVTNNHVIENADEISVILADNTILKATVIGRDPKVDLALLKVEADRPLPTVKWGDSDKMRVGDWSVAIGNPFGIGVTVTAGIVSARSRQLSNGNAYDDYIQTDAAINRGNSGGPLINMKGEVIGINTAIFSPTGASVGIGFASPSNLAQSIINDLNEFGRTRRGWLGVKIQTVTPEIAESLGLDKARGALVAELVEDSPAEKAGVEASDVILAFDGKPVDEMRHLPLIVAETDIDKRVKVTVWRNGKEKSLNVRIAELDEEDVQVASRSDSSSSNGEPDRKEIDELGLTVAELTSDIRSQYDLPDEITGLVIVDVDGDSDAAEKGLRRGDIIAEVQQTPVETAAEAEKVIADARKKDRTVVLLRIQSGEDFRLVPVRIGES
ncbi:MAG: DegQ family serine endoprotease [Rhodospirillaceae bacterium]|jgi:serine protease Do|nr:DegQ family serine endoprotease [Rhodospirillaceae bacterium]MBT5242439.1 DegQ family serine endoprotease [Rhodospirillaceae bacterium]MBT5565253.1 DegQ family serine endoprotease [Rhodospirillaceae bacterium]MBT6091111.1 DegQ family serine endoprotease [Rhodospirillaceae bacterium]MBT7450990.1 DegQ family serine endoprotease [Rhodospirillaceae bacterium]